MTSSFNNCITIISFPPVDHSWLANNNNNDDDDDDDDDDDEDDEDDNDENY